MNSMYKVRDMLCEEVDKIAQKGDITQQGLDNLYKMIDIIMDIDKIGMYKEYGEEEYPEASYGRGRSYGGYGGSSYRDNPYGNADSYARRGGYSERGRGGMRYSRDDGMSQMFDEMMHNADSEEKREAIRRFKKEMEQY